jgi:serine/threonine protein kinase
VAGYGNGLVIHDTGQDAEGNAPAIGYISVMRSGPNDSQWNLFIGFGTGQAFHDGINLDVPRQQYPPMHIPIELTWIGKDRWGRSKTQTVPVPSISVSRDSVEWLGRRWSGVSEVDASWITKALIERWLMHDSPEVAEEARLQMPGARWEQLEPPIAAWGPAQVSRVRDRQDVTAPLRVMKAMRWRKGPGTTAHQRLVREIEITRQLGEKNKNIVQVLDFGIPQDGDEWKPFYVMPLAEATLRKALDFAGNLEAVLNLGVKLASALGAAHAEKVIHRDVKPDNVLLMGPAREPVLADFGICFLITEEGERITGSEANTVGPTNYVAPELLGGKAESADIDPRADVYSLGKTLYFALSGGDDLPREYHTQDRYDLRKRFDDPRMAHFHGLLERMVVEDPNRRFPTMQACGEAFTRALANIKRSVPYTEGMYGGVVSPVERAEQLARILAGPNALLRKDGIRDAIAEARKAVDAMVSELTSRDGRPRGQDEVTRAASSAAEALMAVGLPLVIADDSEGFQRWLDEVVAPLLPDGTGGMSEGNNARRAANVLAFYGVSIVAWRRERLVLLSRMLKKYDAHESAFIHLRMHEGEAQASWAWISESLKRSSVLARTEIELDESLIMVAGLGALHRLLSMKPEALAAAVPDRGDLDIDLFPAFMPQANDWIESLPAHFLRTPVVERAVAQEVFGTTPDDLREGCKRITPKLRRILGWVAGQLGRDTGWIGGIPHGGSWSKWTGADIPSPLRR